MIDRYVYEVESGLCYGYFVEANLYNLSNRFTHYQDGDLIYDAKSQQAMFRVDGPSIRRLSDQKLQWIDPQFEQV